MVPPVFVALEALPLTPNGKVDRKALAEQSGAPREQEGSVEAPRDPVELELATLFASLLEVERVSIHDSFFELGGNSLLATRLTSRLRESFHVEVPLRVLFQAPTVEGLAVQLTVLQLSQVSSEEAQKLLQELERLSEAEVQERLQSHLPARASQAA
jgi:acyl carrier protein